MEEGRKVSARLERIEALQYVAAPTGVLLAELRGLLQDGEAWLAAGVGESTARSAAGEKCREREEAKEVTPEGHAKPLI
jgi:hypothetical protein